MEPMESQDEDQHRLEMRIQIPLRVPTSIDAAGIRVVRNLRYYALFYAHFLWIILAITLIPKRKVSLICLVITTYVASAYDLILRTFTSSFILHGIVKREFVLCLMAIAAMVEIIATDAGLHLAFTFVGAVPVILVHAVFWVRVREEEEKKLLSHP